MDKLPIYRLVITETEEGEEEVDFVALVESPAIQRNFLAFGEHFVEPSQGENKNDFMPRCIEYIINEGKESEQAVAICSNLWEQHFSKIQVIVCQKCGHSWDYQEGGKEPYTCHLCGADNMPKQEAFESYNDYPQSAKDNAERGIMLNAKVGNSCATQVGKIRATQIMKGENLSKETIKRTYSYLSRAAEYYDAEDTEACGTISYLLWGGESMHRWAESKMNQEDFHSIGQNKFSIENPDQRIVSGPLMIADLPIYRRDEEGEYYVVFSAEEIKKIVQRFFKKGYQAKVNIEHGKPVDGVFMFESYIIDRERGINPPTGFEDIANGSWFGSFKVENEMIWKQVKEGTFKGFSVEGIFKYEKTNETITQDEELMNQIFKILSQIEH
jgi:hypothetical protein